MKPKTTDLVCWDCKQTIKGAKTFIDGKYRCSDCTYYLTHPGAPRQKRLVRHRAPRQTETLFPLPPPRPRRERDAI